uniref:Anion exchange protein n=1 Tax=Macrostomum lignano TaxID=282301 RepID=A0A1I8FR42_9PLAT
DLQWKETARWIKFEEDVEEGGERWSKPHVATLSLFALFEVRNSIYNDLVVKFTGEIMLECEGQTMESIADLLLDRLVQKRKLTSESRELVKDVLLKRHLHLHEKKARGNLGRKIRSFAEIGRKHSSKDLDRGELRIRANRIRPSSTEQRDAELTASASSYRFDQHFMKKIPPGAETSNILVGSTDFLDHPVTAFIRLKTAVVLGDLTEVPVPTRFIYVLLGRRRDRVPTFTRWAGAWPRSCLMRSSTMWPTLAKSKSPTSLRSRCVLISVTYPLRSLCLISSPQSHSAIAVFLSQSPNPLRYRCVLISVTNPTPLSRVLIALSLPLLLFYLSQPTSLILPPNEWDPSIRIEPPKEVPSQEPRKQGSVPVTGFECSSWNVGFGGQSPAYEETCHTDPSPSLRITGRLFGGLVEDVETQSAILLVRYSRRYSRTSPLHRRVIRQPNRSHLHIEAFKKLRNILKAYPINPDWHPNYLPDFNWHLRGQHLRIPSYNDSDGRYYTNHTAIVYYDWDWDKNNKLCTAQLGQWVGSGAAIPDVFFFSCLLAIGTFVISYGTQTDANFAILSNRVRMVISDFAVMIAIVGHDWFGPVGLQTPKLPVPESFSPTLGYETRGWLVSPADWHQFYSGHSLVCCATVLSINHVMALKIESETTAPGERPKFLGVVTRTASPASWIFLLIGLSVLSDRRCSSTSPCRCCTECSCFMGISSLRGVQFVQRWGSSSCRRSTSRTTGSS